jgi:hypothetical protein
MSSPLTKETMSPTCGEKRLLPDDDNDEVLVPAARRRRQSAVLKESMESTVSNHNSTDTAQEEGSENENFKLRKYLPKKSAIVWTEDEVREFKRSRCVCHCSSVAGFDDTHNGYDEYKSLIFNHFFVFL